MSEEIPFEEKQGPEDSAYLQRRRGIEVSG